LQGYAQSEPINPRWLHGFWQAKWISCKDLGGNEFAVCHFRKSFRLDGAPGKFIIHVSADNRYRLYVNGRSVGTGPARSDLANWNFETYDIGPFLNAGENLIAATVWNFAEYRPYSQISFQTAFLLQGDGAMESAVNTGPGWKATRDNAYTPLPIDKSLLQTYIVTAEGERVDANKYPWGFEQFRFNDSAWTRAAILWYAAKSRTFGTDGNWMLVPRTIPLSEEREQRFSSIRRSDFSIPRPGDFLKGSGPIRIPAHSKVKILFDQGELTNAYPRLKLAEGRNARVRLSYAEALMDRHRQKGNRDSIEGKELLGFSDEYISDGGGEREYSPLFFRTFRYLQLDIETGDESLDLIDFQSLFTGYPFKENAYFNSDEPLLSQIWKVGWHTARLCAVDTYFDCPYYEQLQ
jgi:hypothetical protein